MASSPLPDHPLRPASPSHQQNMKTMDRLVDDDMKIICDGRTFLAHKVVVCSRSDWFKDACKGDVKESSGEINLEDKDAILIQVVLEFIYKNKYSLDGVAQDVCTPADETSPSFNQFGTKRRKSIMPANEPPVKRLRPTSADFDFPQRAKSPEKTKDMNLNAQPGSRNWPPLSTCPASYFHARVFAEADYFMIHELKQSAKEKFSLALDTCDIKWRLELLIVELWSQRADYQDLQKILMNAIRLRGGSLHDLFVYLDRQFLQSVPQFTADVCWEYMKAERHFGSLSRAPPS
ncbi:hypothetical protein N7466_001708 [Penicillium verhagenii]|uniref:uncharacterized protein n=1 Tax=Penicillium verhagenii TaxID=1562060 RepID=UPI0025458E45|nr:uncharacterized protein N7466_001708 [Penicillium verhagenii]KAJ5938574.1 hypothetical protein N7466_001708 [Penicillium verhagenii]